MAAVRFDYTNSDSINEYFELLESTLIKNDLWDKRAQFYNVDETGMPLDATKQKVCAMKGQKKVRQRGSGNKGQITVLV